MTDKDRLEGTASGFWKAAQSLTNLRVLLPPFMASFLVGSLSGHPMLTFRRELGLRRVCP